MASQEQRGKKRKHEDDTDVGYPANAEGRGQDLMMHGALAENIAEDDQSIHHDPDSDEEDVDDQLDMPDSFEFDDNDDISMNTPTINPHQGQPNFMEQIERAEQAMAGRDTAKELKFSKHGKDPEPKDNGAEHPQSQDKCAEDCLQEDDEEALTKLQFLENNKDPDDPMEDADNELEDEASDLSMQDLQPSTPKPRAGKTKKLPKGPMESSLDPKKRKNRGIEKFSDVNFKKGIQLDRPPLDNIDKIFEDMTKRAIELRFEEAIEPFLESGITIGTMCSGTEAPIFAFRMICEAAWRHLGKDLKFFHRYSAEIVAFKQAFIERNFHPPIIFRDIREIGESNDGTAITAYGARAEIPRDVDIVVAGFSCVDFSRMNKNAKQITDVGESGDTFRAILAYAKKYKPAVFIIENIENAPWNDIQTMWEQEMPYKADYIKLDTKHYYLPQTRQRGYMVCFRSDLGFNAATMAENWRNIMRELHRPASVSVEAFLLPDDDPRLQTVKVDSTKPSTRPRREVDWTICHGRHQDYRELMALGTRRPITKWINGGTAKAPDYWWQDWTKAQVERLWDTFEISYLRNALKHFDSFYKVRIWDLSQNIDRFVDSMAHGITGCLTPSGQPFLTTRGGPVTGLEALALQGLPINELVLTRETPKQLQDLAGNAMTTTVVGAALLSALITGSEILKAHISQRGPRQSVEMISLRNREVIPIKSHFLQAYGNLTFGAKMSTSLHELEEQAIDSVRLCYCEGPMEVTTQPLLRCQDCGHHSCEKCGVLPRHKYEPLPQYDVARRVSPRDFHINIRNILPMRIQLTGLSMEHLDGLVSSRLEYLDRDGWNCIKGAARSAREGDFRFRTAKRTSYWTITYDNSNSTLELIFTKAKTEWQLYGRADIEAVGTSHERNILKDPIARMVVKNNDILAGSWEFRIPVRHSFRISIKGTGELVPAWRNKLGLRESVEESVFSSLNISFRKGPPSVALDHAIDGDYELLENCGTASGSLHKKVQSDDDTGSVPLFLFLDPERIGDPRNDSFVFSTDIHRMVYGELPRNCIANLAKSWRPSYREEHTTKCNVYATWSPCNASLQPFEDSSKPTTFAVPVPYPNIPIFEAAQRPSLTTQFDCMDATTTLLAFMIKSAMDHTKGWEGGALTVVDPTSVSEFLNQLSWLTERARDLGGFSNVWRPLKVPPEVGECLNCAPKVPDTEWKLTRALKTNRIAPCENVAEATRFETAVKSRPNPFRIQYELYNNKGFSTLEVAFNLPSLCHRALGKLGSTPPNSGPKLSWRLDTNYVEQDEPAPRPFVLMNCRSRSQSDYDFPATKFHLRPEQKRSLLWMIGQESPKAIPWIRQEIVEATVPNLHWLLEVRATKRTKVLGGVLADEVGYGKTATILALIDSQMRKAEEAATKDYGNLIALKATLIIVPSTIVAQWQDQVTKFLGKSRKVLAIINMASLGNMTVEDFQDVDIIIVSWETLRSEAYWRKVALVAGLPEGPSVGGRPFSAWHTLACHRLREKFGAIQNGSADMSRLIDHLKKEIEEAENDEALQSIAPTKRFTGAKYVQEVERQKDGTTSTGSAKSAKLIDRSYAHLRVDELQEMKSPCFEMFHFARVVIDEYTYVDERLYGGIKSLISDFHWILSGTPPLMKFGDAHKMSGLLHAELGSSDEKKSMRDDRTDAEVFRALVQANTSAWHQARRDHAQIFMNQFVRQDRAEYDEIDTEYHTMIVEQHTVEKTCGKELQSALEANGWKIVRKRAKGNLGDRDRALNTFLLSSQSAEEAILKSVAHFEGGDGIATADAFKFLVMRREGELHHQVSSILDGLRHALWLKIQLNRSETHAVKDEKYQSYMAALKRREFASEEVIDLVHDLIVIAEMKVKQEDRDEFYRDKPSKAELKREEATRKAAMKANRRDPTDMRPYRIRYDDYPQFVTQLRVVSAQLRRDTNELVNRMRSLNFLKNVASSSSKQICGVEGCNIVSNLRINVLCGHITCQQCTSRAPFVEHCLNETCDTATEEYRMVPMENLRVSLSNPSKYGAKLDGIIKLIKHEIPKDEQVLVFVQFDDLMFNVEEAFRREKISCSAITSRVKGKAASAMISDFQKQRSSSKKKKVLLLNSANESAAGANLVNANHVIFVCPLLTEDGYKYASSRKQAIGRARRFGQTNKVHVYDFLALETFDVDLFQQREGVKLVSRVEGSKRAWRMVQPEDVRFDELKQKWGTGHLVL